jgi:pectinesterase
MLFPSLTLTLTVWLASHTALGTSRTSPPAGAHVVRYESPRSGEFATISSAVNALPDDNSAQTIFIFPGTYIEQVRVTRLGPLTVRC